MKRSRIATCFMTFPVCLIVAATVPADEPAERFLEALRENGYYDIALVYLDSISNSPAVSDDFRKILPFEKAETLIKSTANIRNVDEWESVLDEAQKLLSESAQLADTPELQARSQRYEGNLLYRRARVYMRRSEDDRLTVSEQQELMKKAQEQLQQSMTVYNKARTSLKDLITNFQIDPDDPNSAAKKKTLESTYTKVRIRSPLIMEQLADTYPPGSENQKKYLTDAASEYGKLWESYFRYAAGLDSCLFAARCYYKLGDYDRSISYLQEIFSLNDSTALRGLKRKAMVLATDAWMKKEPYPYDDVIANFQPTVERLTRAELRIPDWQRIQVELARAYRKKAEGLEAEKSGQNTGRINNFNRDAVKLAKSISRIPGPHRDMANTLLEQWNLSVNIEEEEAKPVESFVDAKQKGTDHVAEVEIILGEIATAKAALSAARTDAEKSIAQAELDEAKDRLNTEANRALAMFEMALTMADDETTRADVNSLRYLQSVCHFAMTNYFESALIGEFLLDRYPNVNGSRQASGLVVKSYSILHDAAPDENKEFEKNRLMKTCNVIVERWPGSNEAGDAASTLTQMALLNKNFDNAEKYYAMIPDGHSRQMMLGIRIGQKRWFDYKDKLKQHESDPNSMPKAKLDASLVSAKTYLKDGLKAADPGKLTYDLALGSLLLVDAHLETNDVDMAINQLESAGIAPLDLIKEKHPAIMESSASDLFVRETFKVAVKAYLAALGDHPDDNQWVDKAQGVIQQMRDDAAVSNDPQAQAKIVVIYRMIASQLKEQFDAIHDIDKRKAFAKNLARFLESIEKESDDPRTILWAGSTLMSVASSLSTQTTSVDAKPLYQQAVKAFDRVEKLGLQDPKLKIELTRQRAIAMRGLGQYEKALAALAEILKKSQSNLTVQLDAAETLQQWGKAAKLPRAYGEAMMGAVKERDPKTKRPVNLVWGWRKLVQALRDNPKFEDAYYQSLYGLIESRLEYGKLENSQKAIDSALKELTNAQKRHSEMGGPKWKDRFNQLSLKIKQSQ